MNIIHQVTEENYLEEIEKGQKEVNKKFEAWDKLIKYDIPLDEFKIRASMAWKDPTVWAYANLRDKQNNKLKLYYFQDKIVNDPARFIHVSAANQIGKTWAIIVLGLHHAIHTNNASVMIISRSEEQAKGILDEMKWMLRRSRLDFSEFYDDVDNRTELHLKSPDGKGTSAIRVFPPTKKILGFPATLVLEDETGFWEKQEDLDPIEYYQQAVEPRTNTTKTWKHPFLTMGKIVSITNPNGQDGLAWYLHNDDRYHQYIYNWLAKPENKIEEYNYFKAKLPPIRFASIYAADYLLSAGGFISLEQYLRFAAYNTELKIEPGTTIYFGGDFAGEDPRSKNTDWTTIYGVTQVENKNFPGFPRIKLVYRKEYPPGTAREEIYRDIEIIKNLPGVTIAKFGYDKIGVGDSVKRDLMGRGILNDNQIEILTYSLPNKSEVYLNFQSLFLQDMIEGCEIPKLKEQILALKVEKPTGSVHIKVHHKTEGVKDDEPDALANACYVARMPYTKPSIEFVPHQEPGDRPEPIGIKTVICTKCEQEGLDGYHQSKANKHFEKVPCAKHRE
ncbi:MAG: hypothetical protein ACTSX6_04715 [Candidatus Heimdallarchaeaceae archaeon]